MAKNVGSNETPAEIDWYLGPRFSTEKHQIYVDELLNILSDRRSQNIALTGAYGTGKSSVIQGLQAALASKNEGWFEETKSGSANQSRRTGSVFREIKSLFHRCLRGFCQFFGFKEPACASKNKERPVLRKGLPKKPILVSLASFDLDNSDNRETRENRLQREIVKQLIFREEPRNLKKSNFRRIVNLPPYWKAVSKFLLALIVVSSFLIISKHEEIANWILHGEWKGGDFGFIPFLALWGGLSFIFILLDFMIVDRPRIKGITAGPAHLELSDERASYFDKYLAEIIYYFQVSKVDLVILEDLDRFANPRIFESLRELNQQVNFALNGKWKLQFPPKKKFVVRFLYATRDSIFVARDAGVHRALNRDRGLANELIQNSGESLQQDFSKRGPEFVESDVAELRFEQAQNRTKFFDAIVPVVPFSGQRNAVYLLDNLVNNCGEGQASLPPVDSRLIQAVARYVVDYRLIRNITSEFLLFEKIRSGDGSSIDSGGGASEDRNKLLAMISYKNLEIDDFEKIAFGKSKLDLLFEDFNSHVVKQRQEISAEIVQLSEKLTKTHVTDDIARKMDLELWKFIDTDYGYDSDPDAEICAGVLVVGGRHFLPQNGNFREFWEEAIEKDPSQLPQISWEYDRDHEDVPASTVDSILEEQNLLNRQTRVAKPKLESQKLKLIDFQRETMTGGIVEYLNACGKATEIPLVRESEKKLLGLLEKNVGRGLTYHLILLSFIDRDFRRYVSTWEEDFQSKGVQDFISSVLLPCAPRPEFELETGDSEAIVRYMLDDCVTRNIAGAINADLLLYLACTSDTSSHRRLIDSILDDVKKMGTLDYCVTEVVILVAKVLEDSSHDKSIYKGSRFLFLKVVERFPGVLDSNLFRQVDDQLKSTICDLVLKVSDRSQLIISDDFVAWLSENSGRLDIFTSEFDPYKIQAAAEALKRNGAVISDLTGMSESSVEEFIVCGNVEVSKTNLTIFEKVLDSKPTLVSLQRWPNYLSTVIKNLSLYLETLVQMQEWAVVVGDNFFPGTFNLICSQTEDNSILTEELLKLFKQVEPDVTVEDLTYLNSRGRIALFKGKLIEPTVKNILHYIHLNGLDPELQKFLNVTTLTFGDKDYFEIEKLKSSIMEVKCWKGGDSRQKEIYDHLTDVQLKEGHTAEESSVTLNLDDEKGE